MAAIRQDFARQANGLAAAAARSALVDALLCRLWKSERQRFPALDDVALLALGGYGRGQLFPCSDVDLLFAVERSGNKAARDGIRSVSQALWDAGLRVSTATRSPAECERFEPGNAEFSLALLDCRILTGNPDLAATVQERSLRRLLTRDRKRILRELSELTRARHARYGDTLFHLEPNVKECPGGLRDANVTGWLRSLRAEPPAEEPAAQEPAELREALAFLASARSFLHFRHERDDNVLDWQAQDAAAEEGIGLAGSSLSRLSGAAHWMRVYFRHARTVERRLQAEAEPAGLELTSAAMPRRPRAGLRAGFTRGTGLLRLPAAGSGEPDPACQASEVLQLFAAVAETGARLTTETEARIAEAIPGLSASLPDGAALWNVFRPILLGRQAGAALRALHALGLLELILPEFHGIDALVIRDAYHRYTVDEHTFVLIDTLHGLADRPPPDAPRWRVRFGLMLAELAHPELLLLGALLHDTGKARAGENHAHESAMLAENVLARFAMDAFETAMVLQLIEIHLEMSATLRRDIFDAETVRGFTGKVQTHESLNMLTLFTYADIAAVHPDALTPWKAENLWRLLMAASNELDRHVDEERISVAAGLDERTRTVLLMAGRPASPVQPAGVERFLDGLPERYLLTRTPEAVLEQADMASRCPREPVQLALQPGEAISEITLVTPDRPGLFADLAGALAAWGMNIVTADAFSNAAGIVVDSFRFTDTFQTLTLNPEERVRFLGSLRDLLAGRVPLDRLLAGRRRGPAAAARVEVETSIEFDPGASARSTLLQVVAQDVPGLLRAISLALSAAGCNVEVALVDTEGESAIDVFYITRAGVKLSRPQERDLRRELMAAVEENRSAARKAEPFGES